MKCLIIDAVHSSIAEEFSKYMQVDTHMLPTQEELAKLIPDYDVLIMRVDPAINKEILDAAKNLKVIGVCSVGLNHIDLDTAKEKGIQVINAPGLNGNAVAELTIAKMLDIARHTIPACYDVKVNKTWDKYKFVGSELRGKTLGVLGFGRIGQRVGELARAFKMDVVAYDPYLPAHVFEEQHAKSLSIDPHRRDQKPVQRQVHRRDEGRRGGAEHGPRRHCQREGYVRGSEGRQAGRLRLRRHGERAGCRRPDRGRWLRLPPV